GLQVGGAGCFEKRLEALAVKARKENGRGSHAWAPKRCGRRNMRRPRPLESTPERALRPSADRRGRTASRRPPWPARDDWKGEGSVDIPAVAAHHARPAQHQRAVCPGGGIGRRTSFRC